MDNQERFYPESQFGGFTDIDGSLIFFSRVNALLESTHTILDVGCGRGAQNESSIAFKRDLLDLRRKVRKVIGIDVDPNAQANPFIHEFHLIENSQWPIKNNSIDLLIVDNVLEHIEIPDLFFQEISRVLKCGGYICIRTPNKYSYIALTSHIVPDKYHSKITSVVQESRKQEDVFPTFYRCNTARNIRKMMKKNGIEGVAYGFEAEPSYLSFSTIAYFLGVLHQRYAPRLIKPAIFAFGSKKY